MRTTRITLAVIAFMLAASSAWALGTVGRSTGFGATTTIANSWSTSTLTSGTLFRLSATSKLTGTLLDVVSNTMTTGNLLKLTLDSDAATGAAKFINCLGGSNHATAMFTVGFDGNTSIAGTLGVAGAVGLTQVNAAGGSANPFDYTGTLGIMNGSDDFTLFDVNITNANHTGTNTIQVLDIANITGDAEATETAVKIGTGWDTGITCASPVSFTSTLAVTGNTAVAGTITGMQAINTTALDTETTLTMDPATHASGTLFVSAASGSTTVTLPAVATSAGASWEFYRVGAGAFAITGPAGTLVTFNNAGATTATWGTSGQIIGSSVKVVCTGAKWLIINQGGTTVAGS